jgi:uncharacterized protein (UPF0248 family)
VLHEDGLITHNILTRLTLIMAATEMTRSVRETVAHLADQIDCELLSYTPPSQPPHRPGPLRHLFPVGPYAIGLWHPGDVIHLVCLTDNTANTFWEYIAEKLDREDLPKHDCIVSELHGQHIIWLHYCNIPQHFDLATVQAYGFPRYPVTTHVPEAVRQNLVWLHHTWHLHAGLSGYLEAFRNDYHRLRLWAEAAGIFSKSFGTLDAESLVWMLFSATKPGVEDNPNEKSVFSSRLQSFVNAYSKHYNVQSVLTASRSRAYPLPPDNATDCCTAIAYEIKKLAQQPSLLNLSREQYYLTFCDRYTAVILITAECWVPRCRESFHCDLVNEISHLPERSRSLGSTLKALRIWPHPFKPSLDEWVYVVGVHLPQSPTSSPSRSTHARTPSDVMNKQYLTLDGTVGTSAIRVSFAKEAKSLPERYSAADPLPSHTTSDTAAIFPRPGLSASENKFPPASQALSRLRWDPAHAPYNYEVGYLDRFEGLMWLPLEQWGKETEDEEFIPEHRIRILRRVVIGGDGIVIWDRENRICQLS